MSSTQVPASTTPVTTEKAPVYFVSLGCPKNLVDSQVMLGLLEKDRYSIVEQPEDAEVIIVNTCSFIQASKEESIETILEMAQLKEDGNCKVLVASGCLTQRYSKQLTQEMPEVDLFIGTGQYHKITEALAEHKREKELGAPMPKRVYVDQPAFIHSDTDPRMHTGPSYTAYLKLSEGCNRRCAFCIIPKLRGNVRSRTVESLVKEAKAMAERGVRELNLVAQDLTHYGIEGRYEDNLVKLLGELVKIEGVEWIRLHYVYPDEFSDELVEIIAREPKIVKYLDMPIQHTNDAMLKSMGRRLTKAKLFDVVGKLREKIPGVVFRTSIIVGFPGETEEQFEELCHDLEALNLDHVGVFRFSKEEGTRAAEMDGQLHASTKRSRAKKLTAILQRQRQAHHEAHVGQTVQVLVEGPSEETDLLLQGRLPTQAQEIDGHVLINDLGELMGDQGEYDLRAGDLIEVEVSEATPNELIGRAVRFVSRSKFAPAASPLALGGTSTDGTAPGAMRVARPVERPRSGASVG